LTRIRMLLVASVLAIAAAGFAAAPALADYGRGAQYQIELSANLPGNQGGGVWLWITLNSNGTGDYAGADCGRGGASSDKGNITSWSSDGTTLTINGVALNGFGGFPTTVTVPAKYGHYTGTLGSFLTLPLPPPVLSAGFSQLQVAP
jgi:hypothetical protein